MTRRTHAGLVAGALGVAWLGLAGAAMADEPPCPARDESLHRVAETVQPMLAAGGEAELILGVPRAGVTRVQACEIEAGAAGGPAMRPVDAVLVEGGSGEKDTSLRMRLTVDPGSSPWRRRHFEIAAYGKAGLTGWGEVQPVVSDSRHAWMAGVAAIVAVYLAAVAWTWDRRRAGRPYDTKYPAVTDPGKVAGFFRFLDPVLLTANEMNKASPQKLQALAFTLAVALLLLVHVLENGTVVDVSSTVLLLMGVSVGGAAVGQATAGTRERLDFDNWTWLVRHKIIPVRRPDRPSPNWAQLVTTRGEFDIYKLQTLLFSGVVIGALLAAGPQGLPNFDVKGSLLALLGVSQAIFVAGVLVKPPSIKELDDALEALRKLEEAVCAARRRGESTVEADAAYDRQAKQVELMLETTLDLKVDTAAMAPTCP